MSAFDLFTVLDSILGVFAFPFAVGCLLVPLMAWQNYREADAAEIMQFACLCNHRLEAIHGDMVIHKNEVVPDTAALSAKLDLAQFWHMVSRDAFFEEHPVFLRIVEKNDTALMRNIHQAYLQNTWKPEESRFAKH